MVREIPQGKIVLEKGQKLDKLCLIMKGNAEAVYSGGKFALHSGDVIGLCEANEGEVFLEYRAVDPLTVLEYPYGKQELTEIFDMSNDAVRYFRSSMFRQLNEVLSQYKLLKNESSSLYDYLKSGYEDYIALCEKYHVSPGELTDYDELIPFCPQEDMPGWISGYYATLEELLSVWDSNKTDHAFITGFLMNAGRDIHSMAALCKEMQEYIADVCSFLMNDSGLDLFELYVNLYGRVAEREGVEADAALSLQMNLNDMLMQLENQGYGDDVFYKQRKIDFEQQRKRLEAQAAQGGNKEQIDKDAEEAVAGSLETILAYAQCDEELAASFRRNILKYRGLSNRGGTEDEVTALRRKITQEFYKIYIEAFQVSVSGSIVPEVVKMFFEFGYVDEELAGISNAVYLYKIVSHLPTAPDRNVYSFYEWLTAIYDGRKEPGRNEFDMDYGEYLHEQKRLNRISAQEENVLLKNNKAKVMYELENVFPVVNKMTFGRISTFCPVFSDHNVQKPLDSVLVSDEKIEKALNGIRNKDFGAYYRETLYSNTGQGVPKEYINVEVLPDIILMPNTGTRGVMWQEIEGKRRVTPARMMISIFQMEELAMILIRLTGEFRWEMCKRVQGARWNDVSERSLTSEYFDYIQFYRKNQDLSTEARDRVKTDMARAKNSFKEMFIRDYILWILYESNGSPRLNKVARTILFQYCPFSKETRDRLKANPLYRELAERYEVKLGQRRHHMDNLCQKISNLGKPIPEEIERERQYVEK